MTQKIHAATALFFTIVTSLFFSSFAAAGTVSDIETVDGKVNKSLFVFSERYKPELKKLGTRVHTAFSYSHANYSFIEGDDGIILIDGGWYPGEVQKSLDDYRKITNKPIVAVIYTHIHTDHVGGVATLIKGASDNIPVYAPEGWETWLNESFTTLRPTIFRRAAAQLGALLPRGIDGTVGTGDGISPTPLGIANLVAPTQNISTFTEITISGVRIQLIPAKADLNETLFVWLPDDKVLFSGDILAGTFPYIETVRMELARDPRNFIRSFSKALELQPNYLVSGHGRILEGPEDVRTNLEANREITEFMVDQVDRLFNKGLTADQIIDQLKLPPTLASNPDLQPHYHRIEWIIKTMIIKRGGFYQELMDIVTLTQSEEASRLIKLIGGEAAVVEAANQALKDDDPRWAARLATNVLAVNPSNEGAFEARINAYQRIAATTDSANERNYVLTEINTERGEIPWRTLFSSGDYLVAKSLDIDTALALLKARFKAEETDNLNMDIEINFGEPKESRNLVIRNNVLHIQYKATENADISISLARDILNQIIANMTTFQEALKDGKLTVNSGDIKNVERFVHLIE